MLALFLICFIVTVIYYQAKHQQLYLQKVSGEILTLEKERKRIATNLHDDIGPLLSIIKLQISCTKPRTIEESELQEDTYKNIDTVVDHIRGLNKEMMPYLLLQKGLYACIQDMATHINRTGKLHLSISIRDKTFKTDESTAINLLRILQEIIHNTIKHAKAQRLDIHLWTEKQQLKILTRDNGVGFIRKAAQSNSLQFGLRSIVNRAELLCGELHIKTAPGKGVQYLILIPINNVQENN